MLTGMGFPAPHHQYTYAEYLNLERDSPIRHEYFEGEIYAMAGGTPEHAALAMEIGAALVAQLRGGSCRVYGSDLRVRVLATGLATYPDITVVCGPLVRDPESPETVTNPKVVVEVTSKGTEDYDRGERLEHYKRIPSLDAALLVSHREPKIDLWHRTEEGRWTVRSFGPGEMVDIAPIRGRLNVDEVYRAAREPGA
jgi:Uma2 family endonuclease